jgi:hypothetical protein
MFGASYDLIFKTDHKTGGYWVLMIMMGYFSLSMIGSAIFQFVLLATG